MTLNRQGAGDPPGVNRMGRHILSAVDVGRGPSGNARGAVVSAAYIEWDFSNKRPDLPNGGLHFPYAADGPCQFDPRVHFQPVRQGHWGAHWMGTYRARRRLSRNFM